jgi:hypothetical protein
MFAFGNGQHCTGTVDEPARDGGKQFGADISERLLVILKGKPRT